MENGSIAMDDAKDQLAKIMNSLSKCQKDNLLKFAVQNYIAPASDDGESEEGSYNAEDAMDDPVNLIRSIAKEIRSRLPFDAVLPSEKILPLDRDPNSKCDPERTRQVDAFLYDDDEVEALVKKGMLDKHYCLDCGSTKIRAIELISHSTSQEDLFHIFNNFLPPLDGKIVLDVGSRLGAVLYGAYAYTDADRIIGVEMNDEFCNLQREIIAKFKMDKRIEISNSRIEQVPEIVKSADVVVLNNVFKNYFQDSEQVEAWQFLRSNIRSGAYVVARPKISKSLANLSTGIQVDEWLREIKPEKLSFDLDTREEEEEEDDDELGLACYLVL